MLHCGCNLPPNVKRNQLRQATTKAGLLQNLAHLQRVDSQRLKSDAHLHRAIAYQLETRLCNATAHRFDFSGVLGDGNDTAAGQDLPWRDTSVVDSIQIASSRKKRIEN
jgi:hypothetical protein